MKYLLLAFLLPVSSLNAAEARLLIEPAHRAGAPFSESDLKMFCKTQEDLLLSATIAERVAKKFKTDHKPSIAVSRLPRTSILSVTVTGLAENDRKYLDALLNEFVSYKKSQHAASIAAATKALRDQIRQTDDPKVRAALKEKLLAFEIESKARAGVVRHWINSPNKAWLPTGCPPRDESIMAIQTSTLKSERAPGQPVAAL